MDRDLVRFSRLLRPLGTPRRARAEKAYLKSELRFLGVTLPDIRRVARAFVSEHPELDARRLRVIAEGAYATKTHEQRSVAIALLELRASTLRARDLPWLIGLVRRSDTWAHVDWLAVKVIGPVIEREPKARAILPHWAVDRSFWVRRTALLAQHDALKAGAGDFTLFARLAASMLDEREFFIRKAIGWVLREVSKRRPQPVYAFLRDHRDRLSALTLREGAKYLSDAQRRRCQGTFVPADGAPRHLSSGRRGADNKR